MRDEDRDTTFVVGVDIGTTYCAAATRLGDGRPEIVALGNRATVIPSVAFVAEDGLVVGEVAERRGSTEPGRVIREFKRRVGDPEPIERGGRAFSAEKLMAEMLQGVLAIVAEREGRAPTALTLTHPANWSTYKRELLIAEIGALASLPPVRVVSEPEAAAISYAVTERIDPGGVVAVYDLGGGTFDAAVLRRSATGFEVIGRPTGIERLGGIDFDTAVLAHVNRYLDGALDDLDLADPLVAAGLARLRADAVEAKEALSSEADVTIPVYLPDLRTEVRLTRVEFEAMIRPALEDSIGALRRVLASAGIGPEEVAVVLLVGGSSRIPLVAQMVGAALGRPVAVDVHPKHVVALGAAAYEPIIESAPEPAGREPDRRAMASPPPDAVDQTQVVSQRAWVGAIEPSGTAPDVAVAPVADAVDAAVDTTVSRRWFWLTGLAIAALVVAGLVALWRRDGGAPELAGGADASRSTTTVSTTAAPGNPPTTPASQTTSASSTTSAQTAPTTPTTAVPAVTPAECVGAAQPFVCVTDVQVDGEGNIVAQYDAMGFVAVRGPAPNRHVHFFFPVGRIVDNVLNAGSSGPDRETWIAWDDPVFGPGFNTAGYTVDDARDVGAAEICALVANSIHEVTPGTGNCFPLPVDALE